MGFRFPHAPSDMTFDGTERPTQPPRTSAASAPSLLPSGVEDGSPIVHSNENAPNSQPSYHPTGPARRESGPMRVNWTPGGRTRRLSAAAIGLLNALDDPRAEISFSRISGLFQLTRPANERTLELLVRIGLVKRDASLGSAKYSITDAGRRWIATNLG